MNKKFPDDFTFHLPFAKVSFPPLSLNGRNPKSAPRKQDGKGNQKLSSVPNAYPSPPPRHSRSIKRESIVLSHPPFRHSRRTKRESIVFSHPPLCHSRRIKRESIILSHPPQSWLRSSPPAKPAANRLDLYPFLRNIRPNVKTDQPSSSNRTSQPQYILPKDNTPIHDAQKLKKEADQRKQRMTQTVTTLWSWRGLNLGCMFLLSMELIMAANVLNNSDAIQMTVLVIR